MQIAVLVRCKGFGIAQIEDGRGLLPGLKPLDEDALVCVETDEADVVAGLHGMGGAAHADLDGAHGTGTQDGKMLLVRTIDLIGDELDHLVAAADGHGAAIDELEDYIATSGATIEMKCHNNLICLRL